MSELVLRESGNGTIVMVMRFCAVCRDFFFSRAVLRLVAACVRSLPSVGMRKYVRSDVRLCRHACVWPVWSLERMLPRKGNVDARRSNSCFRVAHGT